MAGYSNRARPGTTSGSTPKPGNRTNGTGRTPGKKSRSPGRSERDYHVGDLDRLLVEEGTRLLKREGLHELSLRKVARAAGVSHTAAYRHYEDKNALLAAIALDGFHRFHGYQVRVIADTVADFNLRFLNLGWTYVRFAVENPEYARIMYGGAGLNFKDYPALASASRKSYRELLLSIRLCQQNGLIAQGQAKQKTLAAWSIVHGLSMLVLDGQFPVPSMGGKKGRSNTPLEKMVKDIIVNLYYGLR